MDKAHDEGVAGIPPQVKKQAFVTLVTYADCIAKALVLGHSLIKVGTKRKLVCLLSKDYWGKERFEQEVQELMKIYLVLEVEPFETYEDMYGKKVGDAGILEAVVKKVHCWKLKDYTKCVFLDCNTLVMQNIDDLFEREELSAAPDIDSETEKRFDTNVFVFEPSKATFDRLTKRAFAGESMATDDKDLLNAIWAPREVSILPIQFNTQSKAFFLPEKSPFKSNGVGIRVIHFAWPCSPLREKYYLNSGLHLVTKISNPSYLEFVRIWWEIFTQNVSFARVYMEEEDDKPADQPEDPDSNLP